MLSVFSLPFSLSPLINIYVCVFHLSHASEACDIVCLLIIFMKKRDPFY